MDIIRFIQQNIIGDDSAAVGRRLSEFLQVIATDVYEYHHWRWLRKSKELTLETDTIEYNLSGSNNDLSKVISMRYGTDEFMLSDDIQDEDTFYKTIYGQVQSSTPLYFVPKEQVNAYTWTYIIYPCSESSLGTITYAYKKTFALGDVPLYPNPLVFVYGILNLWFAAQANKLKGEDYLRAMKLAEDYLNQYVVGKEEMRTKDSPVTHPKTKLDLSEERKRFNSRMRRLRTLARR